MLPLWSRGLGVLFWGGGGAEGDVVEGGKLRGYWRDEQLEVYFGFWGVLGGSVYRGLDVRCVVGFDEGVD